MSLKQEFEHVLIPAVKRMRDGEIKHLEQLTDALSHRNANTILVTSFIRTSKRHLAHYEQRLDEYIKYAQGLTD